VPGPPTGSPTHPPSKEKRFIIINLFSLDGGWVDEPVGRPIPGNFGEIAEI
jgi:hypothetical protein